MPNSPRKSSSALALALLALGLAATPVHAKPAPQCRIVVPQDLRMAAGEKTEFFVGLIPSNGFAVSTAGPLRISLRPTPDSGLSLKRSELVRRNAVDPASTAPRFPVLAQSSTAGTFRVEVLASFWLCKSRLCRPQSVEATFSVLVEAPAAVPPAATDIK